MFGRPLTEWLKPLFEKVFAVGVQSTAREHVARFAAEVMKADQAAAETAAAGIDYANQLESTGDRHKELIAGLLKNSTVAAFELMQGVAAGRYGVDQAREALAADPFAGSSDGSSPTSEPALKAIGHGGSTGEEPSVSERRGPGRPKGSKTRPKSPAGANDSDVKGQS